MKRMLVGFDIIDFEDVNHHFLSLQKKTSLFAADQAQISTGMFRSAPIIVNKQVSLLGLNELWFCLTGSAHSFALMVC